MRKAAEMALSDLGKPKLQLIIKDDGGNGPGAQLAVRQAIGQGAEVILGPLFAQPVTAIKPIAGEHMIPIIAFSNDIKAASAGVYLLSPLPNSDVDRIVGYAISQRQRSFVGLLPANSYGNAVESEFKLAVARGGGKIIAIEHYKDREKIADAVRLVAEPAGRADVLFIPDSADVVTDVVSAIAAATSKPHHLTFLGTQLWDDPKIFSNPLLEGGWYPGPDPASFRAFAQRYRNRYHDDPPHVAALAYDAVTLVANLAKTNGLRRITNEMLINPSGFGGIIGKYRFLKDGTNQTELAILRVTPAGGKIISAPSYSFTK
jgi:ABC-type branched-subunit amino acid transport system substrate-binding protein